MQIKYLRLFKMVDLIFSFVVLTIYCITDWFVFCLILETIVLSVSWYFYRCPHCQESLDLRQDISDETYCPYCGKRIC
ncbi:MAG: hypothetical protein RR512_06385 [Coprobacillus sp.]